MVFVGRKGTSLVSRIRKAAASPGEDARVAEFLYSQYQGKPQLSPYRAWRLLQSSPVVADVRYGGRTLATNVFIPPYAEAVWFASPYNGGKLTADELTLVEHHKEESKVGFEAVAIKHTPPLTAAERAALEKVPASQLELNLAPNGACCDNVTDVLQIIIAATFAMLCGNPFPDWHIYETDLKGLSPVATAIRLMDARREMLGHEH
jgi:hypothetical protein